MGGFFTKNLEIVYFLYGLAFFTLGVILFTQIRAAGQSKYKLLNILLLLAVFAMTHSVNEFLDMFKIIYGEFKFLNIAATSLLIISYLFLFSFGYLLLIISGKKNILWLPIIVITLFLGLPLLIDPYSFTVWNISARYFLGFSGSMIIAIGFRFYGLKHPDIPIKKYLINASIAFGLYGLFAGLFVTKAGFFPASLINNDSFIAFTGIPPQVFRALFAEGVTFSMWNIVNVFNLEKDTEIKRNLGAIKTEKDKAKNYLKIAGVMMVALDKDGKVKLINKKGGEILGYPENEIIGKNWFDNFLPEKNKSQAKKFFKVLMTGNINNVERYENPIINKEGQERLIFWHNTIIRDKACNITGTLSSGEDITERKHAEEIIKHQALYDSLTKLPNRNLFNDRLVTQIKYSKRYKTSFAVLFLDLDNFKDVNDTYGHAIGDKLLRHVSKILKKTLRKSETIARLGGDEFLILIPNIKKIKDIEIISNKILKALSKPWITGKIKLAVSASIGIAVYPDDIDEPEKLIHQADIAMYVAKEKGCNRYWLHSNIKEAELKKIKEKQRECKIAI